MTLIPRIRVKGYWVRQSSSPETEPDFYNMASSSDTVQPDSVAWANTLAAPQSLAAPPVIPSVPLANQEVDDGLSMLDTEPIPLHQAFVSNADLLSCWADINTNLFRNLEWTGSSKVLQVPLTMNAVTPPVDHGYGMVDQQELADFLVDVDLSDERQDQAFKNQDEHELARIYYGTLQRNNANGLGTYQVPYPV